MTNECDPEGIQIPPNGNRSSNGPKTGLSEMISIRPEMGTIQQDLDGFSTKGTKPDFFSNLRVCVGTIIDFNDSTIYND